MTEQEHIQSKPEKSGRSGKPLRPALVISDKTISEYQTFLNHLLVGLAEQSIPVALVCGSKWRIDPLVPPSIRLIQHDLVPLPWVYEFGYNRLLEELAGFKPTILHCLCENGLRLVKKLAWQLDLPFIVTVNSLRGIRVPRYMLDRVRAVTVSARSIGENIQRRKTRLADRVKVISMSAFVDKPVSCFRNRNQQICMVTAGSFQDESMYENLLAAIRRLAIEGYEFMLFIMGQGPAERKLRREISLLGLSEVVTIVPRLQGWRSVISSADIFIRPWPEKSFNPLILEAMSTGTAVAACTGGVDDFIIDGQTAVVFEGNDEISIVRTLKGLLDRPEDAYNLAVQAQQHIKENHKVSAMVEAFTQLYRQPPV